MKKVFLIICLGYLGDLILTSKLTRDIKKFYPSYKLVYICDSPYISVAKNLPGVDEVIPYNRKKELNIINYLKFILKFPYKNQIFHTFIIHQNKKNRILLAKHLGAKEISTWESFKTHSNYVKFIKENTKYYNVAYFNANMLSFLTNKVTDDEDIDFSVPNKAQEKIDSFLGQKKYNKLVGINPQAGDEEKCWDVQEFVKFVKILINKGKTPIITGVSKDGTKYIEALKNNPEINQENYINMIDKTNFEELGALYKRCSYVVSVDTGSSHMACAVGVPTLVLFFRNNVHLWAPMNVEKNPHIYNSFIKVEDVIKKIENKIIYSSSA